MDPAAAGSPSPFDRDLFRHVVGHFASGVTVITAHHDGTPYGLTASAFTSLSLDPPMTLVCINRNTGSYNAIAKSGAFAVNILRESQGELAMQFAQKHPDKFRGVAVTPGPKGLPLLSEALAHIVCRVVSEAQGGSHAIFLGEVEHAEAREGMPLTYFRGKMGRLHW